MLTALISLVLSLSQPGQPDYGLPTVEPYCDSSRNVEHEVVTPPIAIRVLLPEPDGIGFSGTRQAVCCGKLIHSVDLPPQEVSNGYFNAPFGIDLKPFLPQRYSLGEDAMLLKDGMPKTHCEGWHTQTFEAPKCTQMNWELRSIYQKTVLVFRIKKRCTQSLLGSLLNGDTESSTSEFLATATFSVLVAPIAELGVQYEPAPVCDACKDPLNPECPE